ncbi:hypothetical protein F2P81_008732 [Scophthalmus maximus]|uniref:Uncharacterized protein n=1 Tax=Scophthalmus maximus TaxID=52904 RepID=A0A6A4T1Q2_SCOMX|nr:hypothetical protein F2P81_008732 [Scophthalmus maximus]
MVLKNEDESLIQRFFIIQEPITSRQRPSHHHACDDPCLHLSIFNRLSTTHTEAVSHHHDPSGDQSLCGYLHRRVVVTDSVHRHTAASHRLHHDQRLTTGTELDDSRVTEGRKK